MIKTIVFEAQFCYTVIASGSYRLAHKTRSVQMSKQRYYRIDMGMSIPDFSGEDSVTTEYIAQRIDFVGKTQIGSKVLLTTTTQQHLSQHHEGCELRELRWLDGKYGTVVGYLYL
jgi:hypothetical protein